MNKRGEAKQPAMNQSRPTLIASPTTPKVLQGKMRDTPYAGHSRTAVASFSGVVQANVVGGNQALQARLNLWNTRLTRGATQTVGSYNGKGSTAPELAQSIQRKARPGVEAFRVPLRPKSGGMPIPDDV